MMKIDIVFDGPPGPIAGRFVEVEDQNGHSINAGEWLYRGDDGYWVLRINALPQPVRWPVLCLTEDTEGGQGFTCSLALDHEGDHLATESDSPSGRVLAEWKEGT